jgi:hypothetical protein
LRIRLFDYDYALVLDDLGFHFLLFSRFQITLILSFLAHALHRIHAIALLREECIAQIGGPLNVVCQPLYNIRESRKRLDAWIPGLFRHGVRERLVFQILIFVQPLLKLDDLERIRGRRQSLGQQWIGIKCYGRYERIQLVRRNLGGLVLLRGRGRL